MFSDVLMCQAEPTRGEVNVKDMFLSGDSTTPMFDSSVVSKKYVCMCLLNMCMLSLLSIIMV